MWSKQVHVDTSLRTKGLGEREGATRGGGELLGHWMLVNSWTAVGAVTAFVALGGRSNPLRWVLVAHVGDGKLGVHR